MYTCPVCGYNELPEPPEDWLICPSCLTTFGYSDENWGVDALRQEWIQAGAQWGSTEINPPEYWSPIEQLRNIGYEVTDEDRIAIARRLSGSTVVPSIANFGQLINVSSVSIADDQQNIVVKIFDDNRVERESPPTDFGKLVWRPAPA